MGLLTMTSFLSSSDRRGFTAFPTSSLLSLSITQMNMEKEGEGPLDKLDVPRKIRNESQKMEEYGEKDNYLHANQTHPEPNCV